MAVAAGGYHSLALRSNGTVLAWGFNTAGQAIIPAGLQNVKAIAAGYQHSLALLASGRVAAWGDNTYGQLNVPGDLTNATAIASGGNHTLALRADGTVVAWGDNQYGQCTVPVALTNVIAIGAGYNHSLAIKSDGTLVVWGSNQSLQTVVPAGLRNVVTAIGGYYHTSALTEEGRVVNFGGGTFLGQPAMPTNLPAVKAIAGAYNHTLALLGYLPPTRPPVITGQPHTLSIMQGDSATFEVTATGRGLLSYQWQFNGNDIPGATDSKLNLSDVATNAQGQYQAWVSNALGVVFSDAATLTVQPLAPPVIVSEPESTNAYARETVIFRVAVTGLEPFEFQWEFNGSLLPGATNATLTVANITATNAGTYAVSVRNRGGEARSRAASLTVVTSDGVVREASERALRAALRGLPPGGTVRLEFDGDVILSNSIVVSGELTFDATGHAVSLSGANQHRIFEVPASSSLTLSNLVLVNGQSTNGGAIYNEGLFVAASCVFRENTVSTSDYGYSSGFAFTGGGAIYNSGNASLDHCSVSNNRTLGIDAGMYIANASSGRGGGIFNSGMLRVDACTFQSNSCVGGKAFYSGRGGFGRGGAIYNASNLVSVASTFNGNRAQGGSGGTSDYHSNPIYGGHGLGGAVWSASSVSCTNATFYQNSAVGGVPDSGQNRWGGNAMGGAIFVSAGEAAVSFCTFATNVIVPGPGYGSRGQSGSGWGAAISGDTGRAMVHSSIFSGHPDSTVFAGNVLDLGYNVCSSRSPALTNSQNLQGIDVQLGPFADNGGPVRTLMPTETSPAIGFGDTANSPATDARNIPRPQNGSSDAGAVEYVGYWPRVVSLGAQANAIEGQLAMITVTCKGNPEGTVAVDCMTQDGTAIAGADYVATNATLVFDPGETSKVLTIQTLHDTTLEENETIKVTLSNVTGPGVLGSWSNAVLVITDAALSSFVSSAADLEAATAAGGEVVFGNSGTYSLSSPIVVTNSVIIDGRLRQVTIASGYTSRLFEVQTGGTLTLRNLTLTSGLATNGGALLNNGGDVRIEACLFQANAAVGVRGNTSNEPSPRNRPPQIGSGGAIWNALGAMSIDSSVFLSNSCAGGGAGDFSSYPSAAAGKGGAIYNSDRLVIRSSAFAYNSVRGGDWISAGGADGLGGAICNAGLLALTNITISGNTTAGGAHASSPSRGTEKAWGGGLCNESGTAVVQNVTVAANQLTASGFYGAKQGYNLAVLGGEVRLGDSIVATSTGTTNCYGTVLDLGYNLSSDQSCRFTNSGSMNGVDPRLATLTDNGGPTFTIALLPDSPAIDAGRAISEIHEDQRGFGRPFGSAPDIGAFEWQPTSTQPVFRFGSARVAADSYTVTCWGLPQTALRIEVSQDLQNWNVLINGVTDEKGAFEFQDALAPQGSRFYRAARPTNP